MPTLGEMFHRLLNAEGQTRAARSVEYFGWFDMSLGMIILVAPFWAASILRIPAPTLEGSNYIRLVGLLVGGLGMLYVVSGRLNATGFVFASLLDRPIVPVIMAVLWYLKILPGPMALAFSISDFGGFLWTLWAWGADTRYRPDTDSGFVAQMAAGFFAFVSGVVRNSRTFHPDGRVFRGTVRSLHPSDPGLARAAERLVGAVLLRIGMGVMKRGMPAWLADRIPDAPSIAARFYTSSTPEEIRLERHAGEDLDLLATAGGDRLWKLLINLSTGGFANGLHQFDYFRNIYSADVPYKIDNGGLDVWVRLVPDLDPAVPTPSNGVAREAALTSAVARRATVRVEAQRTGDTNAPFVPISEIRFEEEIEIDQEALHFDPIAGRDFVPHGFLTRVRRAVYPASFANRGQTVAERARREQEGAGSRLFRYLNPRPIVNDRMPQPPEDAYLYTQGHWVRPVGLIVLGIVLLSGLYLAIRFTRDSPVEYADDELHFKHGSTGGERLTGIPYWFWVALPELFPELLPDRKTGRGFASFGMIYEKGGDPYELPVGVSMRNVRGIDMVYLNCAVCHTGTVRTAAGAPARVISGMPAQGFDLGGWAKFLMAIPLSEKFTPDRMLDQIRKMQDDPRRVVAKPDLINRLIFKFYAVYAARERLLMLRDRLSFVDNGTWGPGRVDTFNAPKALLNFPMKEHPDFRELIGNADFPSIWNQGPREGMQLHWDGNNTSVNERNLSAAFGTGAYPPTLDAPLVLRTAGWLLSKAQPPPFREFFPINESLATQGEGLYKEYCAVCHGTREAPYRHNPQLKEELVGTVIPIAKIGTDRWRLDSYTWLVAANQSTLYAGYEKEWGFDQPYPQRFSHFRKTGGYANAPLDGIWLRAPYLHNGSVPNLRELLEPASKRTKIFYRGNDVYDPQNVGFVSNIAEQDGRMLYRFDTAKPGNGHDGHEGKEYGTDLPPADKQALLEYLKTF